jgi:hypothetical protein
MQFYRLLDGVRAHNRSPHTFEIPSNAEKAAIRIGDYVKLCFLSVGEDGDERMWVEVTKINGNKFAGVLMNQPFIFAGILFPNMLIEFEKKHIIGFEEKEENRMSYYINPPDMTKEEWLRQNADVVLPVGASPGMRTKDSKIAVCLVDCVTHSTAAVAYDEQAYTEMATPNGRAKVWFFVETERLLEIIPGLGKAIAN